MNKTKKTVKIDWRGLKLALTFCEHVFGLVALAFMGAGFVTVDVTSFKVLGMAGIAWAAVHIFKEVSEFNKRLDEIDENPSKEED